MKENAAMKMKSLTVILFVLLAFLIAIPAFAGTVATTIDTPFAEDEYTFLTDSPGDSVRGAPGPLCPAVGYVDFTLFATNILETNVEDVGLRSETEIGYGEQVLLFNSDVLAIKSETKTDPKQTRHRYDQALVCRNLKDENGLLGVGRKAAGHRQRT
jgi:hypothetical protein